MVNKSSLRRGNNSSSSTIKVHLFCLGSLMHRISKYCTLIHLLNLDFVVLPVVKLGTLLIPILSMGEFSQLLGSVLAQVGYDENGITYSVDSRWIRGSQEGGSHLVSWMLFLRPSWMCVSCKERPVPRRTKACQLRASESRWINSQSQCHKHRSILEVAVQLAGNENVKWVQLLWSSVKLPHLSRLPLILTMMSASGLLAILPWLAVIVWNECIRRRNCRRKETLFCQSSPLYLNCASSDSCVLALWCSIYQKSILEPF